MAVATVVSVSACVFVVPLALASAPAPFAASPDRHVEPAPPNQRRACRPLKPHEHLRVDLNDVPLGTVARLVSCALQRNLVFQPTALAKRRVTVFAPAPVDGPGLWRMFAATLRDHRLITEERGGWTFILLAPGRRGP